MSDKYLNSVFWVRMRFSTEQQVAKQSKWSARRMFGRNTAKFGRNQGRTIPVSPIGMPQN